MAFVALEAGLEILIFYGASGIISDPEPLVG